MKFKMDNPQIRKLLSISISLIAAAITSYAFSFYYISGNPLAQSSIVGVAMFALFAWVFYTAFATCEQRIIKYSFILGIILSSALVLGRYVYNDNSLTAMVSSFGSFFKTLCYIAGFSGFYGSLFALGFHFLTRHNISLTKPERRWQFFSPGIGTFFIVWCVIFIAYIPCYLAYYPGILSYDTGVQLGQALGLWSYSQFHPVLHTFIMGICVKLEALFGIAQFGIIFYSILQMLLLSAAFSYAVYYMSKLKLNNVLLMIVFLLFALNPVNAIMSFTPTKDVYFAMTLILLTILIIDMCRQKKEFFQSKSRIACFILSALLCCMFRNNALYVIVLLCPVMVLMFKGYRIRLLICFLLIIIFSLSLTQLLFPAIGIRDGDSKEALSVPMMQIASVVAKHKDEIPYEQSEIINKYLPYDELPERYNPRYADWVKDRFNTSVYNENSGDFYKVWFDLLEKYPGVYIDAFLSLNLPYWYPDATFPDSFSSRRYIETNVYDLDFYPMARNSILPDLYEKYEAVADYSAMREIPVVSTYFSLNSPIWILLVCATILAIKKKPMFIAALLPSALLWLSYMAGPVSNFRYIFPIFALYPIFIVLALQPEAFAASEPNCSNVSQDSSAANIPRKELVEQSGIDEQQSDAEPTNNA